MDCTTWLEVAEQVLITMMFFGFLAFLAYFITKG